MALSPPFLSHPPAWRPSFLNPHQAPTPSPLTLTSADSGVGTPALMLPWSSSYFPAHPSLVSFHSAALPRPFTVPSWSLRRPSTIPRPTLTRPSTALTPLSLTRPRPSLIHWGRGKDERVWTQTIPAVPEVGLLLLRPESCFLRL